MTLLFKTLFAMNNMDRVTYRLNAVDNEFCYEKKITKCVLSYHRTTLRH